MRTMYNHRYKRKPSASDPEAMRRRAAAARDQWLASHPEATVEERERALQEIARRHGI